MPHLGGAEITPLSQPLPFFAYPILVATFAGWIVTLLKNAGTMARPLASACGRIVCVRRCVTVHTLTLAVPSTCAK
jgi:hypothetical protein